MTSFDPREDQRQLEQWLCEDESSELNLELIADKVINGFERCEEHCPSRNHCGSDGCYCVRANFPTPQHYETYKELMRDASKVIAINLLAKVLDNVKD